MIARRAGKSVDGDMDLLRATGSTRRRVVPDRNGKGAVLSFCDQCIGQIRLRSPISQPVQQRKGVESRLGNATLRDETESSVEWRLDHPLFFEDVGESPVRHHRY